MRQNGGVPTAVDGSLALGVLSADLQTGRSALRMEDEGYEATALRFLRASVRVEPRALLVLGSGLGEVADGIEGAVRIAYADIPGFPASTVPGHAGALVAGVWSGVNVVALAGRFHLYEGWTPAQIAFPIRVLTALGPTVMIVTNAAGSVRPGLLPGDLMLIADHINLMWRNPLVGPVRAGESRFPDMADPYDAALRARVRRVARELRVRLEEGVYAGLAGPSYETPAEVRMLARLGADAVGMSTVPETIVARSRGVRVVGISCITNLGSGLGTAPLSHAEVMEAGARVRDRLVRLVQEALPELVSR
jgi:purine-nucleoside phosphorylase